MKNSNEANIVRQMKEALSDQFDGINNRLDEMTKLVEDFREENGDRFDKIETGLDELSKLVAALRETNEEWKHTNELFHKYLSDKVVND